MANYFISTTVKKAFAMLECIAQYQPILPPQIQQNLKFDKSNVHRLLATLVHLGYIKRVDAGYILTYKMYALGNTVPSSREIIQLAKPHMGSLSKEVKHNVSLCVENQNNIVRIFLVEFPGDLRVAKEQDFIFPLNCSATGKLYLAHLEDTELQQKLEEITLVRKTERSITSTKELIKAIEQVKKDGYSTEIKEFNEQIHCAAVPIYDHEKSMIAGVSIVAPSLTFPVRDIKKVLPHLFETAKKISGEMGAEFESQLFR